MIPPSWEVRPCVFPTGGDLWWGWVILTLLAFGLDTHPQTVDLPCPRTKEVSRA